MCVNLYECLRVCRERTGWLAAKAYSAGPRLDCWMQGLLPSSEAICGLDVDRGAADPRAGAGPGVDPGTSSFGCEDEHLHLRLSRAMLLCLQP